MFWYEMWGWQIGAPVDIGTIYILKCEDDKQAVLWIRDILVRIRIRGSVPLANGTGSWSCYFRPWPSRRRQNLSFSASYFLKAHLHNFSKIKSHKEDITKQEESRFFLLFLLDGSVPLTNGFGSGSRRSKNLRILRIRIRIHSTASRGKYRMKSRGGNKSLRCSLTFSSIHTCTVLQIKKFVIIDTGIN